MSIIYSEDFLRSVVEYYSTKPMTLAEVCKHFKICQPTASKILLEAGVTLYTKNEIWHPGFNESYFENIDSEVKAYLLGILLTDGCVNYSHGQPGISLSLQTSDEYILVRLKEELNHSCAISRDKRGCSNMVVHSQKMADDLAKYGVVPRKSLISTLPILDNSGMMRHLIRGIFDGDGSISCHWSPNTGKHMHKVTFCGSRTIVEQIHEYLTNELDLGNRKPYHYETWSMISWNSISDIQKLNHYMYSDATIYLTRKRYKFDEFECYVLNGEYRDNQSN